jgi:cephalosporin hydroxylase
VHQPISDRGSAGAHERITYLTGSSTAPEVVAEVERCAERRKRVMVILDSDHGRDHVLEELRIFGRLVTAGSCLVVEDTNANGHPCFPTTARGRWRRSRPSWPRRRVRD